MKKRRLTLRKYRRHKYLVTLFNLLFLNLKQLKQKKTVFGWLNFYLRRVAVVLVETNANRLRRTGALFDVRVAMRVFDITLLRSKCAVNRLRPSIGRGHLGHAQHISIGLDRTPALLINLQNN